MGKVAGVHALKTRHRHISLLSWIRVWVCTAPQHHRFLLLGMETTRGWGASLQCSTEEGKLWAPKSLLAEQPGGRGGRRGEEWRGQEVICACGPCNCLPCPAPRPSWESPQWPDLDLNTSRGHLQTLQQQRRLLCAQTMAWEGARPNRAKAGAREMLRLCSPLQRIDHRGQISQCALSITRRAGDKTRRSKSAVLGCTPSWIGSSVQPLTSRRGSKRRRCSWSRAVPRAPCICTRTPALLPANVPGSWPRHASMGSLGAWLANSSMSD